MSSEMVTGKPELLKRINRNIIIKLIIMHGVISRSELSRITKLALPSVMRIVEGLISENLIKEVGKGDSSGGRKPSLITLNQEALYIIGVEIAIKTTMVLTDLGGNVIDRWESPQALHMTPEEMLEKINENIERLISSHQIDRRKLAGIGIGTPGTNFKHIKDIENSILRGWEKIDVKAWFESKTDLPIFIDNVARTRTLSELWFGVGKRIRSFIYVFVDQGVGCGIVNNNAIYEGYSSVAGEFGHTIIEYDGKECYCGSRGCVEMYVSAGAITNEVVKALRIPELDFNFKDVMELEADPEVQKVLSDSGKILAAGVANLINIFNPQAVVLGGIVPIESRYFAEAVKQAIDANVFSNNAMNTPVYISEIDQDRICIGSVALVINEVFKSVELS
ncbi:MAG TPA: ROK family protein [Patescibacteria group bacterium]|nr:ROK family protein [Patescibacteria group bacterium]